MNPEAYQPESLHIIVTTLVILSPFLFLIAFIYLDHYIKTRNTKEEKPKGVKIISKEEAYLLQEADTFMRKQIPDKKEEEVIYLN